MLAEFPVRGFLQALSSKKLKAALKPFITQFQIMNIPWMFESTMIISKNLNDPQTQPQIKLASVYAIKYMIQTSNYFLILIIQAYLLPSLKQIAIFDPIKDEESRGDTYFTKDVLEIQLSRIGYNLVRLCTEIILLLAQIKPNKLYDERPTQDPSEFQITKRQVHKQLKAPPHDFLIIKNPDEYKNKFSMQLQKLNDQKIESFTNFVEKIFLKQLKNSFAGQNQLDIRKITLTSDNQLMDLSIELCDQALKQSSTIPVLASVFEFITSALKTGYSRVLILLHDSKSISDFVSQIINIPNSSKELTRGRHFMANKKGTPEQRQKAYQIFLGNLQFWAKTDAGKFFNNHKKPSSIAYYYQYLKHTKNYVFPKNPNLKKQIEAYEKNKENFRAMNKIFIYEIGKEVTDENLIHEVARMKVSDDWSGFSDSSNNSDKQLMKNDKKEGYKQQEELNFPSEPITVTKASVKKEIMELRIIILKLGTKQEALPQNMKIFTQSFEVLQTQITEITDATNEQLEQLMSLYFDTIDAISELKTLYEKDKKTKISSSQFRKKTKSIEQKYNIQVEESPEQKIEIKQEIKKSVQKKEEVQRQESYKIETPKNKQMKEDISKKAEGFQTDSKKSVKKSSVSSVSVVPLTLQEKKQSPKQREVESARSSRLIQQQKKLSGIRKLEKHQQQVKDGLFFNNKNQQIDFQPSEIVQRSHVSLGSNKSQQNQQAHSLINTLSMNFSKMAEQINIISEEKTPILSKRHLESPVRPSVFDQNLTPYETKIPNNSHIKLETPFQKSGNNLQDSNMKMLKINESFDYDNIIQEPSLTPLQTSYHEQKKEEEIFNTFKGVIEKDKERVKCKKQKMPWLAFNPGNSIINPVNRNNSKSRFLSEIRGPEIFQQNKKRHDIEIEILEKDRDRRIKELKQKLTKARNEKSSISMMLKEKEDEAQSLRQQSEIGLRNSVAMESMNFLEDQNYALKKLYAGQKSGRRDRSFSGGKKLSPSKKNEEKVLKSEGTLLNTDRFHRYFMKFESQKSKKVHLKSKQLLHKDDAIEIGCMGSLEKDSYTLFCLVTPQEDIILSKLVVQADENLSVKHALTSVIKIPKQQQYKIDFLINVLGVPYQIPQVDFQYKLKTKTEKVRVSLPVGIHKFVRIGQVSHQIFKNYFSKMPIFRGQEIPYNRRVLKNIDVLQEYLPHIKQIQDEKASERGQVIFGGEAFFKKVRFLLKICIKPNQFLYAQIVNHLQDQTPAYKETTEFYLATISHFLMKSTSL